MGVRGDKTGRCVCAGGRGWGVGGVEGVTFDTFELST